MSKYRFNWGWGILLVYITFMTVFLYFFWQSFKELETNEMVTDDYYEKELVYGEVLAKKKNADTMRVPVKIKQLPEGLKIVFPDYVNDIKGKIILYKPDNSKLDKKIDIKLDQNNHQLIDKSHFISGRWNISIEWKQDNVPYFIEKKLTLK